jgi:hypothetical protein
MENAKLTIVKWINEYNKITMEISKWPHMCRHETCVLFFKGKR